MQYDVVSGDSKIANAESIGVVDGGSVIGTLVQEEGFGGERETVGMEIDSVGERDFGPVSANLRGKGETSGLGAQIGVMNDELSNNVDEGLDKEGKDLGVNLVTVEGVGNEGHLVNASFNSVAQKLFPKMMSDGKKVEEGKVLGHSSIGPCDVSNRLVELGSSGATSEKEGCGAHDDEVGLSGDKGKGKGVSRVGGREECVRDDGKKGIKKDGFCAPDLVWGKVKSHPWWPAQIFERGDASDKARKYFKSKGYFVCYFGDQTFAWNDEVKLKPFAPNFSQMVKQTQMEAFRHAVDCVLDEMSRRVEFGLSCRCIVDDVYDQLKTQVVENAGVREESRIREGGDRSFTASSFEPVKFLDYVNGLAQRPRADVNRLEHVIARAQMTAFYRWKGIYHLAEIGLLIGYVNNEADAPVTAQKAKVGATADTASPSGNMEEDDSKPKKRKKISSDSGHSNKKVKCPSNLMGKKGMRKKDDKDSEEKIGSKSILSSAHRQKETSSSPSDSRSKACNHSGTTAQLRETKPSFRVGESILRIAGQLSQPSPMLKHHVSSHRKTIKDEGNTKECVKHNFESASLDVVLSELHLAAIEPLHEHNLLSNMVTFISDFRNSIVPDSELLQKLEESKKEDSVGKLYEVLSGSGAAEIAEGCFTSSKLKASESAVTTASNFDASCTDKTIRVLEQQTSINNGEMILVNPKPLEVDENFSGSHDMDSTVSSPQQHDGSENGVSVDSKLDEKVQQEESPTALTLKFTDLISIPTEGKLNKIFTRFGPLKESETEVLGKKSCARVVFKRRSDAETAFSSSGKFEIFGPSLVRYQLNYAPSPRKSPSVEAKRRKNDDSSVDGNTARRSILK